MTQSRFGFSITSDQLDEIRLSAKLGQRYDAIMPIDPKYDPTMCRDEFLRNLFAELDIPESETSNSDSSLDWARSSLPMRSMSVSSFLLYVPRMIKFSQMLERVSIRDIQAKEFKLSVMTGRTDRYDELLESMHRSSLFFMFSRVINKLRMMQSISRDWVGMSLNDLPHMLFKWSMDSFLKRCMLPDPVYLDVLMMNYSADVLDWAKFSTDLLEILRYYKYFYTDIYVNLGHQQMSSIIWDQQQLLNIGEELDKNFKISVKTFERIEENSREITNQWWGHFKSKLVKDCQRRSMEATVRLPIEWRYVRDYYATMVEMQSLKDNLPVLKLEKQINELTESIEKDNRTASASLCVYNITVENYQGRINDFATRLSIDLEKWENDIIISNIRLTKTRDDYKSAQEGIIYMRQRVKEVLEQIECEHEADINRIANEQNVLQAELKKKLDAKLAKQRQKKLKIKRRLAARLAKTVSDGIKSKSVRFDELSQGSVSNTSRKTVPYQ